MRNEWSDGLTLEDYARRWVDMAPHLATLTELARSAKVIVEFGIRGGVSTWAFLDGLPDDGRLIGYDLDADVPDMLPPEVRDDPRFELRRADTTRAELPDSADLVMIDSSHEYNQTLAELRRVVSLHPAVIALHDYTDPNHPGVRLAVEQFMRGDHLHAGPYVLDRVEPSQWSLALLVPR